MTQDYPIKRQSRKNHPTKREDYERRPVRTRP